MARSLRTILERPGPMVSIGVWDPFSAIVAEQEGFEVLTLFGSMTSWSMIGRPDSGNITQTEMLDAARRVVRAVSVPLIVDCDDGFGDPMNVRRTVQLVEQIGAAGMYIEDLRRPLRCSALGGGRLIPSDDMVQKIRAAVEARTNPDFFIMARTDDYEGLDEVVARSKKYIAAGVDMILAIGLTSKEAMEKVGREAGVPLSTIQAAGTRMPLLPRDTPGSMGYKAIFHVPTMFSAAAHSMREAARQLKADLDAGTVQPRVLPGPNPVEMEKMVGLDDDDRLNVRYASESPD
ncbi:MAG: isocitrate lyase/PEP mutase family protein [Dehalococcoidia bacterium]|nr:isocitrate lyase/PEP mutase family protein [Dehalococcoidia bacterium]